VPQPTSWSSAAVGDLHGLLIATRISEGSVAVQTTSLTSAGLATDARAVRAWLRKHTSAIVGLNLLGAMIVALATPWVVWHLQSARPLDVLIVDKTVSAGDYREHAGLTWLLRHEKITQRATGDLLDPEIDYSGAHYSPEGGRRIVGIPSRPTDFVYITDAYGIYGDPVGRAQRPNLIDGGISANEVATIVKNLKPNATFIAEFNALASPTKREGREALERALGIRWTGWIGRHFDQLDQSGDLPAWMPKTWKRQSGYEWSFRGPGFIFVSEKGRLVVLVEGIDTPDAAISLELSQEAQEQYGTRKRIVYDYWFDVVKPTTGSTVLASYRVSLNPSGKLKAREVPLGSGLLPAIVRTDLPGYRAYYFAGDFADLNVQPSVERYAWYERFKARFSEEVRDDQTAFYWRIFIPMMRRIVSDAYDRSHG
jgi:hypothetical protein